MISPPLINPIALFIAVTVIINSILRYRLNNKIIDSGLIDESIIKAILTPIRFKEEPLKWGLILLFGGIGLIIVEYVPFDTERSALPFGIEAVCLSIGFLMYYFIIRHKNN